MSITFALPNYSFGTSAGHAITPDPRGWRASPVFSGPSPSEIPDFVYLTVKSPSELVVEFRYANQEPAEEKDRVASADGHVLVRLADKTKKILKIDYRGDIEKFFASQFQIDEHVLGLPGIVQNQTANSFRQNLTLVQNILRSMPQEVSGKLHEALREASRQQER